VDEAMDEFVAADQRVLFLGAGSAGIGIANLLASAMAAEGLGEDDARARIWLFDVNGLLEPGRTDLYDFQQPYRPPAPAVGRSGGGHQVGAADRHRRREYQEEGLHP
jgi:malic enzyme